MGSPFSQVQGACEEKVHTRDRGLEESRNVALLMFTCIRMLLILIYVLYKSKSLTLVTIGYSWIHSWDIFIEYCFGPKRPFVIR